MGWKCPGCGNHVYGGSSVCPYCSPDEAPIEATEPKLKVTPRDRYWQTCQLCGRGGRGVEIHGHHISYVFEIVVPVCGRCHSKIHFPDERAGLDRADELDRLNPLAESAKPEMKTDGGEP